MKQPSLAIFGMLSRDDQHGPHAAFICRHNGGVIWCLE